VTTTGLSASTRAGILGAAWRIASRQGPGAVSVKDVAAAAGVSRQLVYFHYQNRAGLLLAMARHQDERSGFRRQVAEALQRPPVPGFEAFLRSWLACLPGLLPVARALEAAWITGADGGEAWLDRMEELRDSCRIATGRLAEAGRLAAGWTPDQAADWAWARIQPGAWAQLVGLRGWDPAAFTDRLVASLLADLVIS
jgi:AcrR family transcriptional regulator